MMFFLFTCQPSNHQEINVTWVEGGFALLFWGMLLSDWGRSNRLTLVVNFFSGLRTQQLAESYSKMAGKKKQVQATGGEELSFTMVESVKDHQKSKSKNNGSFTLVLQSTRFWVAWLRGFQYLLKKYILGEVYRKSNHHSFIAWFTSFTIFDGVYHHPKGSTIFLEFAFFGDFLRILPWWITMFHHHLGNML